MFEVAIHNKIEVPAPCNSSLRALIRSTFESEEKQIRLASVSLNTSCDEFGQPEYLCRLKLILIADAPIRVVASSRIPSVAVTRAIQRAQSVLNGRRVTIRTKQPTRDHLAA